MRIGTIAAAVLVVAVAGWALVEPAHAAGGPTPPSPHVKARCAGMGWHDRNLCGGRLGRLPWRELACAGLYLHDATVYRTDAACVPFAAELVR